MDDKGMETDNVIGSEFKNIQASNMLSSELLHPFKVGLSGTFEYLSAKALIIASTWPALLATSLFETPQEWWQGLVYLVILDWVAGVSKAMYQHAFDSRLAVRKWYTVVGYVIVCGAAAILSNTFEVLYFFQFLVYITFFLKEFISILETFKLLAIIKATAALLYNRDFSPDSIDEFLKKSQEIRKQQRDPREE